MRVGAKSSTKLLNSPTTLGVILGYRTYRFYQLVARVGTDMPQKHWDRAGYGRKGQQKGQHLGPDRRFSQTPPWGGRFPLAGAWAQRPTSVLTSENFLRC